MAVNVKTMTKEPQAFSPLLRSDWQYVEKRSMEEFTAADWAVMNHQRGSYLAEQQARQAQELLSASRDAPTFGYRINNFQHCLQSATMALRGGEDEETVVVALFHDIGFIVCNESHGELAAALLAPFISEANHWMLQHHAIFQQWHVTGYPGLEPDARERWRGHPHFDWTAKFVARYDQNAIDPDYDTAPLDAFTPMVQRLFSRTPQPRPTD